MIDALFAFAVARQVIVSNRTKVNQNVNQKTDKFVSVSELFDKCFSKQQIVARSGK
jgi:hypothetical protein